METINNWKKNQSEKLKDEKLDLNFEKPRQVAKWVLQLISDKLTDIVRLESRPTVLSKSI